METGDRKLNEVKKVTDMAYVPVIMADGSIGQIAKSDLASVVAGVLGNPLGYKNLIRNEEALDVAVEPGYYGLQASITVGSNTETVFGTLLVQSSPNYVIQIATGSAGIALMRRYDVGSSVWNAWTRLDNFGFNSLAELSAGVAENIVNDGYSPLLQSMVYQDIAGSYSGDIDNIEKPGIAFVTYNVGKLPAAENGFIFTLGAINGYRFQLYISEESTVFCRIFIYGAWRAWIKLS